MQNRPTRPVFYWRLQGGPVPRRRAHPRYRRKKTGPQAGFFKEKLITSKQPEQQQPMRRLQQPKQPKRQPKQPKQQRQQRPEQRPERLRQQPEQPEQQPELQQPVPERPEQRLLSSSKQPEQQPAGRRSAGIFSWVFLN